MLWHSFIFFSKPQEVCQILLCGFFSKRGRGYPKSCFHFLGKQFVHRWVYISFPPLSDKIVKTKTMCKGQICAKYSIVLSFFCIFCVEHIYIYNHRVQDGLVLLFHTQKKEVEGNEAILGPEVISGGVGLEPAFNRKKKIFHVAILRKKYVIMTFPPYFLFLFRLQNVLSYENGTF